MLELVKLLPQPALHKPYLMVIREGKGSFEDPLVISMQGCYIINFFWGGEKTWPIKGMIQSL